MSTFPPSALWQFLERGAAAGRVCGPGGGAAPVPRCPGRHGGVPADPHPQLLLQVLPDGASETGQRKLGKCECGGGDKMETPCRTLV